MADPVLLVALALLAGAPLALAPLPAAAGFVGAAIALRGRVSLPIVALAAIALCASGLRARAAMARAEGQHERVVAFLQPPQRCEAEAVVVGSPVVQGRGARVEARGEGQARVDVELRSGACGERAIDAPFRARLYGAPEDLARGDRLAILADLAPVHLFRSAELTDPRPAIARSGVVASGGLIEARALQRSRSPAALIDRARARVRARIEATFHPDAAAMGRALVLGETDLAAEDDEAFRLSGLSHLLAVSGTHLVIAVLGFTAALRAFLARVEPIAARLDVGRVAAAIAVPAAWIYADFAGGSGSAVRAAAMLGAAMLARTLARRTTAVRVFACSLGALALLDPLLACDVSFGLSAGATAGLVALKPPIDAAFARAPKPLALLLSPIATTLAAMLGCAPILAILAPTMPLLGILANLVAAPLGELFALPVCLAHAVLWWAPSMEQGAAMVGSGALLAVRLVARFSASLGASAALPPPTAWQLAAIAASACAMWAAPSARRRLLALAMGAALWAALEIVAQRMGAPHGVLRVSVLDVGQGDAVLVDLPDGSAMLVDGGGMVGSPVDLGARVIQPVLRARRRSRLAAMVLSHPHPDHFGGLASTLPKIDVGELWDSGQGEDQGAGPLYASLITTARSRGVSVVRPAQLCGAPRRAGGAVIEVLAPCPGYTPDTGANDNSLVLKIALGRRAVLLVGDAEHEEERVLVARWGDRLRADLLKVGHHGSRTSTGPELLAAVRPSLAAISAGVRNRFGHPHPRTLGALATWGIEALRTDRGGSIVWETDGEVVRVSQARSR